MSSNPAKKTSNQIITRSKKSRSEDQLSKPPIVAFSGILWPIGSNSERTESEIDQAHRALRHQILTNPYNEVKASQLRSTTWKILLGVLDCPADYYYDLVSRPQSNFYGKIRNDTFRTLATDSTFKKRVQEDMLVRLLESFVWRSHDLSENPPDPNERPFDFTYVQGMNVLAAPFLYTMPSELEAFYSFTRFIEFHCPLYVQPTLEGVHRGLKLLDECLKIVDRELFDYLRSKNLAAEIYAFPSVLTFCACTKPLDQVLQLWDYLLAFGVGLNVLCVISQLYMMRDRVLAHPSPMAILRKFPNLEAREVIMLTNVFIRELPKGLYDKLVKHPFDNHNIY
ncbi:rab-GTPase-TBC domain-containing protein [Phakopsora pachyrhizi]|nr:rab-GTPase-TBC domain-containing protein [Phakopsora pachyrhizi]